MSTSTASPVYYDFNILDPNPLAFRPDDYFWTVWSHETRDDGLLYSKPIRTGFGKSKANARAQAETAILRMGGSL